ncbi:MAG: ZIP family metal transporter [Candidatus Diapherotrites archaeon]|nr:ZIP family metal transporter [Candidatus Diapherotrites archaeon]
METLSYILISVFAVSALSLVGVTTLVLGKATIRSVLLWLVAFASGSLLGGAFLHLIPESLDASSSDSVSLLVIGGIVFFFFLEKIIHWRHCHKEACDVHAFTYLSLVGDSVHNFIDGLIIAASYLTSIPLGVATTFAVVAHEVPQELGDFGVLVYGGFSLRKALVFNFLSALTAVVGALVGYYSSGIVSGIEFMLLPFAAGGFIYIASSDLIPELHKEKELRKSLPIMVLFLAGIAFMWVMRAVIGG